MTPSTDDLQRPTEEILNSRSYRPPFDSDPPVAMNSDHDNMSKAHHYQRDTSQIQRQDHYDVNSRPPYRRHHHYHQHLQRNMPEIPIQEMYSVPALQISQWSFISAQNYAGEKRKWIILNIQSSTVPECGTLNQEIWGDPDIADIVSQSFVFVQLNYNDERAEAYFEKYYGVLNLAEEGEGLLVAGNDRKVIMKLPHIALLDPVSGYRWKIWEGPGMPDKDLFLADMSEYQMVGEGDWSKWGTSVIGRSE